MPPCGCVSCMEMSLIMSVMHLGRKHMMKLLADSRVESELRNGENDGPASCIMKRASTWARRSLGTSMIQTLSLPWFKMLEEVCL